MSYSFTPIPRTSLVAEGVSSILVSEFEHALQCCDASLRGYMLLKNGKVVAERFWPPYSPDNKVWVYSLSKSFTSTAIGIAVDEGLLSPDDPVIRFFPDKAPANPSENLQEMRIHHLLSMNTGHHEEPMPLVDESTNIDLVDFFLNYPVTHAPGSHFVYNSVASFMLSAILQVVSGQSMLAYLQPRLLEPLGFDETLWDFLPPLGINTGGWGLMLRLEDAAKLGQLYLDGGVYNGRRILSEEWVRKATTKQSNTDRLDEIADWCQGYGYQFWMCRHGAFRGDGAFGQFCVVMPEQQMVLALMSETTAMQPILDTVWQYLMPAGVMVEPCFVDKIRGLRFNVQAQDQDTLSKSIGIQGLQFDFCDGGLSLLFYNEEKSTALLSAKHCWAYGTVDPAVGGAALWRLSNVNLFGLQQRPVSTAAWYEWTDSTTLRVHWAYLETPHSAVAEFVFDMRKNNVTFVKLEHSFEQQSKFTAIQFEMGAG